MNECYGLTHETAEVKSLLPVPKPKKGTRILKIS